MKCVNCGRERGDGGTTLRLNDEDRRLIAAMTGEPAPEEYFYCAACYRIVTDREMGARLIAGQFEMRLRAANHPRAQQLAEKLYKFLIDSAKTKQVS